MNLPLCRANSRLLFCIAHSARNKTIFLSKPIVVLNFYLSLGIFYKKYLIPKKLHGCRLEKHL